MPCSGTGPLVVETTVIPRELGAGPYHLPGDPEWPLLPTRGRRVTCAGPFVVTLREPDQWADLGVETEVTRVERIRCEACGELWDLFRLIDLAKLSS